MHANVSLSETACKECEASCRIETHETLLPVVWLLLGAAAPAETENSGEYFVYFGTYTTKTSKGIYAYRFRSSSGLLTAIGPVAEAPNRSFLALSPNRRYLYAVNWKGSETVKGDTVSAYSVDATGS